MKQRLWPVLLAAGLGLLVLLSLGLWQVQRLTWKNELIAKFDQTKITVSGKFVAEMPRRLIATHDGGPAWQLLHFFDVENGSRLMVSRGKVAQNAPLPAAPETIVSITGHMQIHDKGRGYFDVDNNPAANLWYHWDLPAMSESPGHTGEVLHLIPASPGTEGLIVDPPKSDLRNNHLGYAITWFGLAAVLFVMTVLFLWGRNKT